ncbi:uncharacterized protein F4822DRAFT_428241 [Hypoxylon trugodes]|uniref:uncharacterized protein n=1 Tax=Hypoxylon trugodes TaxID=326681 RepID=UPI002193FB86|nr:uncharacterized protein F4822DRAFT_428241 [Hypoxylon trugodes]KAI1389900.1 hypothetical protein F4822DRAFT_428241 [Hypoxylon trugodes]
MNPLHDLKRDIAEAIRIFWGPCQGLKVTSGIKSAGELPHKFYWEKVDPNEVIPRGTPEWDEAQWKMSSPIIYIDLSKVNNRPALGYDVNDMMKGVEGVIDEYIKIFDNGNESYPAGMGCDPRMYLVIFKPYNVHFGPKVASMCLPPTHSNGYDPNRPISDQKLESKMVFLPVKDGNDRTEWEAKWNEWRTIRDTQHFTPASIGTLSKVKNYLKRYIH